LALRISPNAQFKSTVAIYMAFHTADSFTVVNRIHTVQQPEEAIERPKIAEAHAAQAA
jgi:hypothetical protein